MKRSVRYWNCFAGHKVAHMGLAKRGSAPSVEDHRNPEGVGGIWSRGFLLDLRVSSGKEVLRFTVGRL